MKRKILRCLIKIGSFITVIFVFAGFISVLLLVFYSIRNGSSEMSEMWIITEKSFIILGAIGTLLAVIVALEKEEFNRILYSPDFVVSSTSIAPSRILNPNNPNLVQKYVQTVRIENVGPVDAIGCQMELIKIQFDKNRHKKYKDIIPIKIEKVSYGGINGILAKKTPYDLMLFEVNNPNAESNPSSQDIQTAMIRFNGIELQPKHASMGQYKLSYRLSCDGGIYKTFDVEIDWAGEWSDDISEMIEKFEIKIK